MHKMNKVISAAERDVAGGWERGGSLGRPAWKEPRLWGPALQGSGPSCFLGVKGTLAGWSDSPILTKQSVASNKDIIGRWQGPRSQSRWVGFTQSKTLLWFVLIPFHCHSRKKVSSFLSLVFFGGVVCQSAFFSWFCLGHKVNHFSTGRTFFKLIMTQESNDKTC